MNNLVEQIKQLRSESGVGVMECRKALEQCGQDIEQARVYLRETAAIHAKLQAERETRQGRIELYSHQHGRIGVMVEINTETEFASRSEAISRFAHEIALQVTSAAPRYVRDEEIPQAVLDELRRTAVEKAHHAGQPEKILEQMVEGMTEKFKNQHVLLRQAYIRDESLTVGQLLSQAIRLSGENIVIRRFVRWEICPEAEAIDLGGANA